MRTVLILMAIGAVYGDNSTFGTWKMDPARSTFTGETKPKSLTVRIEPHAKGEVFTLDMTGGDGRATTSSTILYLDGKTRDFEEHGCSGTQSSRRVDGGAVEILRACASGERARIVRRLSALTEELVLEITEQHTDGRRSKRHLVLEKQ